MTATNTPPPGDATSPPSPRPIDLEGDGGNETTGTPSPDPADFPAPEGALEPWAAEGDSCQVYGEDGVVYLISTGESDEVGPGVMAMGLTPEQAAGLAEILWDVAQGQSPQELRAEGNAGSGAPTEEAPTGWASRMRARAQKATTDPGRLKHHLEENDTASPIAGLSWLTVVILVMLALTVLALIASWF